jgi:hypothetical protein
MINFWKNEIVTFFYGDSDENNPKIADTSGTPKPFQDDPDDLSDSCAEDQDENEELSIYKFVNKMNKVNKQYFDL